MRDYSKQILPRATSVTYQQVACRARNRPHRDQLRSCAFSPCCWTCWRCCNKRTAGLARFKERCCYGHDVKRKSWNDSLRRTKLFLRLAVRRLIVLEPCRSSPRSRCCVELPERVKPAQVRGAMTAVIRRMIEAPGTFDGQGWLHIGFCGHQPSLAESYISTGSLCLCSAAPLPLGLPPADAFWERTGCAVDFTADLARQIAPRRPRHARCFKSRSSHVASASMRFSRPGVLGAEIVSMFIKPRQSQDGADGGGVLNCRFMKRTRKLPCCYQPVLVAYFFYGSRSYGLSSQQSTYHYD